MNELLDDILDDFGIASAFSKQLFKDKVAVLELSKNENIFTEGKKSNSEYFLISGVLHRYNVSDKGDSITTGFYMPKSTITPHFARTNKGKSIFSLQSLTNTIIAEIPVATFDNLRYNNREFNEFGQRVIESELSSMFFHEVVFRSCSAKEKLLALREQFPNLENLIPHNIIASYIGITNVSLSRLRNEFARG